MRALASLLVNGRSDPNGANPETENPHGGSFSIVHQRKGGGEGLIFPLIVKTRWQLIP